VPLAGVIAEAVEQARPQVKAKAHHLSCTCRPTTRWWRATSKRLVQVFANIVGNAAKYTPDGGRIDVYVRLGHGSVAVDVCDNGIGMTPDLAGRAFDMFSQAERSADRAQGGLGIGLALVKSLVELHDGTVAAHSDGPGGGSRFTVVLPRLASDSDDGVVEPVATGAAAPAEALDVLIVDDNVDAARSSPCTSRPWATVRPCGTAPARRSRTRPRCRRTCACSTSACRNSTAMNWRGGCARCRAWRTCRWSPSAATARRTTANARWRPASTAISSSR
jgi:hypothetical protein